MGASVGWELRESTIGASFLRGVKLSVAAALLSACSTAMANDAPKTNADRLVDASAQAEIAGNVPRSFSLLHEAVRVDPANAAAHWQLGEMKVARRWVCSMLSQRSPTFKIGRASCRERV